MQQLPGAYDWERPEAANQPKEKQSFNVKAGDCRRQSNLNDKLIAASQRNPLVAFQISLNIQQNAKAIIS